MTSTNENLTTEQSFEIINSMIDRAKLKYEHEFSFYLLWWGSLLVVTPWVELVLTNSGSNMPWLAWVGMAIIGMIGSISKGITSEKSQEKTTFIDRVLMFIWMGCGIGFFTLFVLACCQHVHGPLFFVIAGIGTFSSGMILKYKPLAFGGVSFFVVTSLFFLFSDYWRILLTVGIILGYLIPGILLKRNVENVR